MFSIGLTKRIKEHTIELNRNNYVLFRKCRRNHKVKGGEGSVNDHCTSRPVAGKLEEKYRPHSQRRFGKAYELNRNDSILLRNKGGHSHE